MAEVKLESADLFDAIKTLNVNAVSRPALEEHGKKKA